MVRPYFIILAYLLIAACAKEPVISDDMRVIDGPMPADFSGSWERDYTRGDDVNAVLGQALYELSMRSARSSRSAQPTIGYGSDSVPGRDRAAVFAIARLADEITRLQVLTISQNENEISIARKDDYAIFCAFYDGLAKSTESGFGTELCGWDGDHLVSNVTLPDGLQITHRFAVSQDRKRLRVVTTVKSSAAPIPFTLSRFYTRFEALPADFNCVETLSMRRVCSTGDLEL
jgi:hypothetical protein